MPKIGEKRFDWFELKQETCFLHNKFTSKMVGKNLPSASDQIAWLVNFRSVAASKTSHLTHWFVYLSPPFCISRKKNKNHFSRVSELRYFECRKQQKKENIVCGGWNAKNWRWRWKWWWARMVCTTCILLKQMQKANGKTVAFPSYVVDVTLAPYIQNLNNSYSLQIDMAVV